MSDYLADYHRTEPKIVNKYTNSFVNVRKERPRRPHKPSFCTDSLQLLSQNTCFTVGI